jgi:hypothetical protein
MDGRYAMAVMMMRREWLLPVGAVVFAYLGTQHHNLMMFFYHTPIVSARIE